MLSRLRLGCFPLLLLFRSDIPFDADFAYALSTAFDVTVEFQDLRFIVRDAANSHFCKSQRKRR